jgi:actin-related protein
MKRTFILDNGAYEIKAGYAGSKPSYSPVSLPH